MYLRLLKCKAPFRIATNMAAAETFNDVVLNIGNQTVFIQFKHRQSRKRIPLGQFLRLEGGGYGLLGYYLSYSKMKEQWTQNPDLCGFGQFDDATFVLYTNAEVMHQNVVENELTDFLNTGGACFQFERETHPEVFNFFESLPSQREKMSKSCLKRMDFLTDVQDYEKFLSRFLIFSGGKSENQLDHLIKEEMLIEDNIVYYHRFKDQVQRLFLSSNYFFTEEHNPFLDIVSDWVQTLLPHNLIRIRDMGVKFLTQSVTDLNDQIPSGEISYIATPDPMLTCLKILQHSHQRLILVDSSTFRENKTKLEELLDCWCDLFVVVDDDGNMGIMIPPSQPNKKVVYITKIGYTHMPFVYDMPIIKELDEETQTRLLNAPVSFQGVDVPLKSLTGSDVGFVPVQAIVPLLIGEKVTLGHKEVAIETDYIHRRLRYKHDKIELDVLRTYKDEGVALAVEGVSKEKLQELVSENITIGEINLSEVSTLSSVYVIKNNKEFEKLAELYDTVHCLSYTSEALEYKHSKGTKEFPFEKYRLHSNVCNDFDSAISIPHRVIIVTGAPGMGKSTLLSFVSQEMKKKVPEAWIVRVNLNSYNNELANMKNLMEKEVVFDFIQDVSEIPHIWRRFFMNKLKSMQNVCILFDSFDEIAPIHVEKVTRILKLLVDETPLTKLWVATRPVTETVLKKHVGGVTLSLEPLGEEEQKRFLFNLMKNIPSLLLIQMNFITQLLYLIKCNVNDMQGKFVEIPLLLKLLAHVYENHLRRSFEHGKSNLWKEKLNLLELYEAFIDKKFKIYFDKNKIDMSNSFIANAFESARQWMENHLECAALKMLLSDIEFEYVGGSKRHFENFKQIFCRGDENIGVIVEIKDNKPVFVHKSFTEYFAARWFSTHWEEKSVRTFLKEKLVHKDFQIVRHFFNRIISKNFALHNAVQDLNVSSLQTLLSEPVCNVNEMDKGGRTALHYAAMNFSDSCGDHKDIIVIVKELLGHKAKKDIKEKVFGMTPVNFALMCSGLSTDIINLLK